MARKLTEKERQGEVFTPIRTREQTGGWERFKDVWSEFKWLFVFCAAVVAALTYGAVSIFSNRPDVTVCVISSTEIISDELTERLRTALTPYAGDENADGKVLIEMSVCYFDTEQPADSVKAMYWQKFENEVVTPGKFVIICDDATKQYLAENGLLENLSKYSTVLPEDTYGVGFRQLYTFIDDPELYTIFDGWHVALRNYTTEDLMNNKDYSRSVRRECARGERFFEYLLVDFQPDGVPDSYLTGENE